MLRKTHILMSLILMSGMAACSDTPQKTIEKPYVTNAEYVLERIESAKTSAVAFQVKPVRKTACKYMYVEIGKQNADGKWARTNILYPGKDTRNNFGQNDLKDQVHFAEVDGVGKFGVLALGCEPYGGQLQAIRGLLATFDVEYGKLNYIGELALVPLKGSAERFSNIEVADRQTFAQEQIQLQLPALEPYFHANVSEKFVVKLSPERQAELDRMTAELKKIDKRFENTKRVIEARNALAREIKKSLDVLDLWDEKNGYPQKDLSERKLAEREALRRVSGGLTLKVKRYDDWIDRDIDFDLTEKYMQLEKIAERENKKFRAKYPLDWKTRISKEDIKNPEFKALSEAAWAADSALAEFAELHDL